MSEKSVWINELTWEEIAEYLKQDDMIIFPVGSTEQHGPAGPVGLDSYVAISLAEDVAKKTGILCTPPLWFGDSSTHLGFPRHVKATRKGRRDPQAGVANVQWGLRHDVVTLVKCN